MDSASGERRLPRHRFMRRSRRSTCAASYCRIRDICRKKMRRSTTRRKVSKHDPALPLYTIEEAQQCLKLFQASRLWSRPCNLALSWRSALCAQRTFWVRAWRRSLCRRTGNAAGCCLPETSVAFATAKLRRAKLCIPGRTEDETADVLVMEITYGNRQHPHTDPRPQLAALIRETA